MSRLPMSRLPISALPMPPLPMPPLPLAPAAPLSRRSLLAVPLWMAGLPVLAQESKGQESKGQESKAREKPAAVGPAGDPADLNTPGPLGDKVLGNADAPVTIIEYSSFTCSHCASFHETTFPALKERYIDTGKVRFIFREFPLDPLATAASMLVRCAPPARYFPLVNVFFAQQRQWAGSEKPLDQLLAIARQAGFSKESFEACLNNRDVFNGVNEQKKRGVEQHGINSTPTFFIDGEVQRGAASIEEMAKLIEARLKK